MIGVVRFARTGSIGEAFNFSAIRATIAKIGWVPYIIALVVLMVCGAIFGIVMGILDDDPDPRLAALPLYDSPVHDLCFTLHLPVVRQRRCII